MEKHIDRYKGLKKAFIPTNLYAKSQDGKMRKIKYVDVRGYWTDGSIGIDQYYHSNFAVFQRTTLEELKKIDGYEDGIELDNFFNLYAAAFKDQPKIEPKNGAKKDCKEYKTCIIDSCIPCLYYKKE
jgi:hypothetical protein